FKYGKIFEDQNNLERAVSELILQMRIHDRSTTDLKGFIYELGNAIPEIYLNPVDKSTQNKISRLISKTGKAEVNAGQVRLKKKEPKKNDIGSQAEKKEQEQERKVQKIASKNLEKRASGEEI